MAPTSKHFKAFSIALTVIALSSCGKDKSSAVAGAGEKQVAPQDVSATQTKPANPLTSIIRRGTVEKTAKADGKYSLSVGVDLEKDGKTTSYLFRSEDMKSGPNTYLTGVTIQTKLCEDQTCNHFASDTTQAPISVQVRCNSSGCDSSLALVRGVADQLKDSTVGIEHQVIENIDHRFVGSAFIRSQRLNQFVQDLNDHAVKRSGTLEVNRVVGTPIESIKVYATITPLWYNSVFTKANVDTDVTKLPQYFIKTMGAFVERDAKGSNITENIFYSEQHPNENWAGGGFGPGRVKISWKPASGQLVVSMQDAFDFPNAAQEDGGTLELGFVSDRLVKPALDDQTSPTVDPFWLF